MLICFARATIFFISTTENCEQQQQQHYVAAYNITQHRLMGVSEACLINGMRTSNMKMIFRGIIAMYFLKYRHFFGRGFIAFDVIIFFKLKDNICTEFITVQSVC